MISFEKTRSRLSRAEIGLRSAAITAVAFSAVLLRIFEPLNAPAWFPLSCGAVTGVPCIFCGTTRALHALLNGDFSRALYFNWIAFPIAALALFAVAISASESIARTRFVRFTPVRLTPRMLAVALITVTAVWVLQVSLAISQHKAELLNPRGPLYALLVR